MLKLFTCSETVSVGRIIVMSFLRRGFGLPENIYEPFAWISNIDKIKWTSLEMDNFPVGGMVAGISDIFFCLVIQPSRCLKK